MDSELLIGLIVAAWVATFAYALVLSCRLREQTERISRLADEASLDTFKVGDRVDVAADDVPALSETRIHRMLEQAKDTSRWAR